MSKLAVTTAIDELRDMAFARKRTVNMTLINCHRTAGAPDYHGSAHLKAANQYPEESLYRSYLAQQYP